MVEVLPVAIAYGEGEADGLLEKVASDGFFALFAGEDGENVVGVFGGVAGEFGVYDGGACGHDVGEAGELAGGGVGFDDARPCGDEGDAVAAFPLVSFHAAPGSCSVVFVAISHVVDGGDFGAVVGGEDDDGVVVDLEFFECGDELANDVVEFEDEVAVWSGIGFALELVGGEGGEVDGLSGVEEEEGLFGVVFDVVLEELL